MKIALCQINVIVGDFQYNSDKILSYYDHAVAKGAELVVFPELTVTGYLPQDLLWEPGFILQNQVTLEKIASKSTIPMIIGAVRQDGNKLYNCAFLCMDGKIKETYDKMLLPTYDVFDEDRYFTSGTKPALWEIRTGSEPIKIGVQICEDLWDEDYPTKVSQLLANGGAELIINLSASPYHEGRLTQRLNLIRNKTAATGLPFLYCNLIGGQDELIFDGESIAVDGAGDVLAIGKPFEEDLILIDTQSENRITPPRFCREEKIYRALCLGVSDYFYKTGHKEAILGLSGGIDSALVACLATDALGAENVHSVSMPSKFSSDHSKNDAKLLANNLNIDYRTIQIDELVTLYEKSLFPVFSNTSPGIAEENIQARVRGNLLMAIANKKNWMTLSTGNKTELALGYCTLYGDMSGGLSVISDLSKTDVYAISRWVNKKAGYDRIPESSISKTPSAELRANQVDPFDYDKVSPLVDALIEDRKGIDSLVNEETDYDLVYDLYQRIRLNEYKRRQAAPGLRVSGKAFGAGRRVPIVNHFKGNK